jgi:quercetin dioxygenase-like cupin family protein
VPEDRAGLRFAIDDVAIELSGIAWTQDVPGIRAREADIEGHRWAIVEYAPRAKRDEWCFDGHAGFVISGAIEYEFEDGGPPLMVGEGDAFALSTGRGHRGTNRADEATRLFVIDDPSDSSR